MCLMQAAACASLACVCSRMLELVGHGREPGMFNSLVFSYLKVPYLLNHGSIWPLFSPHFAVPELPWPVTYASLSHTAAGTTSLFISFGKCLCFERAGPMWRTLHFLQFASFCCSDVWLFLGAYVSKLPELCRNSYFKTGDGNLYLCLVEFSEELFLHDHAPPHL